MRTVESGAGMPGTINLGSQSGPNAMSRMLSSSVLPASGGQVIDKDPNSKVEFAPILSEICKILKKVTPVLIWSLYFKKTLHQF